MKRPILFTLLLVLSTSIFSFAQESPTPAKERNWIVGVGTGLGRPDDYNSNIWSTLNYYATVGYKGFTASYYRIPALYDFDEMLNYLTVGYQHVFSKKSNAEVKPVVGLEYGFTSYVVNTGVQYKRHQFLIAIGTYSDYTLNDMPTFLPALIRRHSSTYTTIKYQFLF
tara:strand:- start:418 stop:921 length:504 start_codon:yes stop_codon:yes gene_type:complete